MRSDNIKWYDIFHKISIICHQTLKQPYFQDILFNLVYNKLFGQSLSSKAKSKEISKIKMWPFD